MVSLAAAAWWRSATTLMALSSDFGVAQGNSRHLYLDGGVGLHRRTLSSNVEPAKAPVGTRAAHRRTCSNDAADFQRILSSSQKPEAQQSQVHRSQVLIVEKSAPKQTKLERKPKSNFLGVLDAAISYLQPVPGSPGDLSYSPSSAESPSVSTTVSSLQQRIYTLEAENEGLRAETKRLASQRENYVTHIGTLNTQLLDLQLAFEECKQSARVGASSFRETAEKLDANESLRAKTRADSPRSRGKPPTPSKPSIRRPVKTLSPVSP